MIPNFLTRQSSVSFFQQASLEFATALITRDDHRDFDPESAAEVACNYAEALIYELNIRAERHENPPQVEAQRMTTRDLGQLRTR